MKWDNVKSEFIANIRIEGIDRHGILQELAGLISNSLEIDIRRLNIEAKGEVFSCSLDVKVSDTSQVDSLCAKVLKINGVKRADRVK